MTEQRRRRSTAEGEIKPLPMTLCGGESAARECGGGGESWEETASESSVEWTQPSRERVREREREGREGGRRWKRPWRSRGREGGREGDD